MNAKTLKALKASIRHWERMANGKSIQGEGVTWEYCELCKMFLSIDLFPNREDCRLCPVKLRTGRRHCDRTPWRAASLAWHNGANSEEFMKAARKELTFLKSLLPKGKR